MQRHTWLLVKVKALFRRSMGARIVMQQVYVVAKV